MKFLARLYHGVWTAAGIVGVFALTSAEFWAQFQLWDIRDLLSLGALLISAAGGGFCSWTVGALIFAYSANALDAIRRRRNCPRP